MVGFDGAFKNGNKQKAWKCSNNGTENGTVFKYEMEIYSTQASFSLNYELYQNKKRKNKQTNKTLWLFGKVKLI